MVMMASLLLGSCSPDDILSVPNGNGRIRFDVGVSQSQDVTVTPMNGSATRSAEPLFLPTSSIEMHSGDMTMYANCASNADIPMHNIVREKTTRGTEINTSNFYNSFGLFGYFYDSDKSWTTDGSSLRPESSMNDLQITQSASSWTTSVYWPGSTKKSTFFAYAPHNCEGVSWASPITGAPNMTYTVPQNVSDQKDLLVAKSTEDISCDGKTSVALTFKHALSAIKFVKGETQEYTAIKKIEISGVYNKGTLGMDDMENLTWSEHGIDGVNTYTIIPTEANNTSFLLPQTVPDGAIIKVTFTNGLDDKTYEASLKGAEWKVGYQYTYQVSVNKIVGEFHLEVSSTKTAISMVYNDNLPITIKSYFKYNDGSEHKIPIAWTGKYTIDGEEKTLNGNGNITDEGESISVTITPNNNNTQTHSYRLQNAEPKGTAEAPYNLSNSSGADQIQNTANCYVINAPGVYKLPLVYGNGITNGIAAKKGAEAANNTFAYDKSENFMNHAGIAMYKLNNAPYITGNGYDPTSAEVVWSDHNNLVKEPKIVGDFLVFTVDKSTIQQGNAVVAAKNSSGTIVWSWHIWFTDYQLYTITYGDYKFLNLPLGFVNSSDNSGINQPRNIVVSFLQSMGSAKESLTINQSGDANKGGTCTYYQFGRKDPFQGATEDGNTLPNVSFSPKYYESITYPQCFFKGGDLGSNLLYNASWFSGEYRNLWNIGNKSYSASTSTCKKTIYDPSLIGYKVPPPAAFSSIEFDLNNWDNTSGQKGISIPDKSDFWGAFGARRYYNSVSWQVDSYGMYYSCGPALNGESGYYTWKLVVSLTNIAPLSYDSGSCEAFNVRPIAE